MPLFTGGNLMTRMNKHLLRALGITLALALLLAGVLTAAPAANNAAAAETQETVSSYPYTTVTRDKVNLRAGTSTRTTLIGRIPAGAEITVTGRLELYEENGALYLHLVDASLQTV